MLAFHGEAAVQEKYLARVRAHRLADELIHGEGWDGQRGCAVGCTLEKYDHAAYEIELGIPQMLARLEDFIFENMTLERSAAWPERFLQAPRPGADLSLVPWQFLHWLVSLTLQRYADEETQRACQPVVDGLSLKMAGKFWPAAAAAAARYAADAAAYAAAAARYAAAAYAAASAAAAAFVDEMADKLEFLMAAA